MPGTAARLSERSRPNNEDRGLKETHPDNSDDHPDLHGCVLQFPTIILIAYCALPVTTTAPSLTSGHCTTDNAAVLSATLPSLTTTTVFLSRLTQLNQ